MVFETVLSIFPLIGRMESVNKYGSRRNRILELERAIEIALLVMNVKIHSSAFLESIRILKGPRPLMEQPLLLLGSTKS